MKKNGEFVGADEKYIPENEKFVDDPIIGTTEETTKKIKKTAKVFLFGYLFFIVFIFALAIGGMIFMFTTFNQNKNDIINKFNQGANSLKENFEDKEKSLNEAEEKAKIEHDVYSFNISIQNLQGTQTQFMLSHYLDEIVTSNKTNKEHFITVVYNETSATEENEIVEIKHSLDENKKYEVSLDYDEIGYINKVTIKDIN